MRTIASAFQDSFFWIPLLNTAFCRITSPPDCLTQRRRSTSLVAAQTLNIISPEMCSSGDRRDRGYSKNGALELTGRPTLAQFHAIRQLDILRYLYCAFMFTPFLTHRVF